MHLTWWWILLSLMSGYCVKNSDGISTIDIIRNAIIKSCEQLNIEKERINELNEQNDKARSSLKSLVEFITEIGTTSSDIGCRMGDLNTSLTQINACIKEIQKIANQTNLIAINSAIEAARVGDAGRVLALFRKRKTCPKMLNTVRKASVR